MTGDVKKGTGDGRGNSSAGSIIDMQSEKEEDDLDDEFERY